MSEHAVFMGSADTADVHTQRSVSTLATQINKTINFLVKKNFYSSKLRGQASPRPTQVLSRTPLISDGRLSRGIIPQLDYWFE